MGYLIEDVTPYDFATIYNVLPLWNANPPIDGTGQVIAIAGTSDITWVRAAARQTGGRRRQRCADFPPGVWLADKQCGQYAEARLR